MEILIILYKKFSCASVGNKKNFDNSRTHGTDVRKVSTVSQIYRTSRPFNTKFANTVKSPSAPEPRNGKLPFSLRHQCFGSSTLCTNKNVSSLHGTPAGRQHRQQSHQQPSRHVSVHSPLHSSGPTTTSIRKPPPKCHQRILRCVIPVVLVQLQTILCG